MSEVPLQPLACHQRSEREQRERERGRACLTGHPVDINMLRPPGGAGVEERDDIQRPGTRRVPVRGAFPP